MYAITGITGKVAGFSRRKAARPRGPARRGQGSGLEGAFADVDDAASLASAFKDAEGVFILPPSGFDPEPRVFRRRNA